MKLNIETLKQLVKKTPTFDFSEEDDDYTIILVSPKTLFRYWKEDNWYQRSEKVSSYNHDLPFDGCGKRIESLIRAVNKKVELPPIELTFGDRGISFPDGRHRIMLFSAIGQGLIPAMVKKDSAEDLSKYLMKLSTEYQKNKA